VNGVFQTMAEMMMSPLATMRSVLNDYVIKFINDFSRGTRPSSATSAGALGLGEGFKVPALAKGGVVEGQRGKGVPFIGGEAGPEMVLPLKREVIEKTLAPLMPEMKFPALDRLVEIGAGIERALSTGIFRVTSVDKDKKQDAKKPERNDIEMAPSLFGGTW